MDHTHKNGWKCKPVSFHCQANIFSQSDSQPVQFRFKGPTAASSWDLQQPPAALQNSMLWFLFIFTVCGFMIQDASLFCHSRQAGWAQWQPVITYTSQGQTEVQPLIKHCLLICYSVELFSLMIGETVCGSTSYHKYVLLKLAFRQTGHIESK